MSAAGSVGGRERVRLFIGLPLPADARDRVAAWQGRELRVSDARLVPPENLHITLAFLGNRPAVEVDRILAAMRDAATSARPPRLTVPRYRETRSVGMLVFEDVDGHASALAEQLHGRLEHLGVYERERRPWLPHLTVLRFREQGRPRLTPTPPDLGEVSPSDAALYTSSLRRAGAQYEVLESVTLGG